MTRVEPVARLSELKDGARVHVEVDGRELTILRQGDQVYALRNRCPHANGRLGDGAVVDGKIVCPLHQWRFSLTDGSTRRDPRLRAETIEVRLREDDICLILDDAEDAEKTS